MKRVVFTCDQCRTETDGERNQEGNILMPPGWISFNATIAMEDKSATRIKAHTCSRRCLIELVTERGELD
jgi:hypothetical protein